MSNSVQSPFFDMLISYDSFWREYSNSTAFLYILFVCAMLSLMLLIPAFWGQIRSRLLQKPDEKQWDLGSIYGWALIMHIFLCTGVSAFSAAVYLFADVASECGTVTSSQTSRFLPTSPFANDLVCSNYYAWYDFSAPTDSTAAAVASSSTNNQPTSQANNTNSSSPASEVNPDRPLGTRSFSTLVAPLPIILALLILFGCYVSRNESNFSEGELRRWGHNDGQAQAWLQKIGTWLLFALSLLILINSFFLPVLGTTTNPLPIWVWSAAIGHWFLFAGLILVRGKVRQVENSPVPFQTQEQSFLQRRQWELSMQQQGFSLLHKKNNELALVEAPIIQPEDGGIRTASAPDEKEEAPDDQANIPARPPLYAADNCFAFLWAEHHTAAPMYWKHQADFIHQIEDQLHKSKLHEAKLSALLLSTQRGSGKSSIIYDSIGLVSYREGFFSLILYPDQETATEGFNILQKMIELKELSRHLNPTLAKDTDSIEKSTKVVVASINWLVESLLPNHSRSDNAFFLRHLGLLILEDIEAFSGIRATNMALAMRRFIRIQEHLYRLPVLAMTVNSSDVESSGVEEYAQKLSASYTLSSIEADTSEQKPVHLYFLENNAEKLHANEREFLPSLASLAFTCWNWGAPTKLDYTFSLQKEDLQVPTWARKPNQDAAEIAEVMLRNESPNFQLKTENAWVHIREVPIEGILSLPERIGHPGNIPLLNSWTENSLENEQLVVLYPDSRYAGIVSYLLKTWITSEDSHEESTTWNRTYRPFGVRLICGDRPSEEMLKKHILAAMQELPSSLEDIESLFPRRELVQQCLHNLRQQGLITEERTRKITKKQDKTEITDVRLIHVKGNHDRVTSLNISTNCYIYLRTTQDPTPIQSFDINIALRYAYPGALLLIKGQRYRVVEADYQQFWKSYQTWKNEHLGGSPADHHVFITCAPDDCLAYTRPILERNYQSFSPHCGTFFISNTESGGKIVRFRGEVTLSERYFGREETEIGKHTDLQKIHYHSWGGVPPEWKIACKAYFTALPIPTGISENTRITLRRMLNLAGLAMTQLDGMELEVDILPTMEHLGPEARQQIETCEECLSSSTESVHLYPIIMIMDLRDGNGGLLDALGPSPWRYVQNLFQFVLQWAKDITSQRWEEIGYTKIFHGENVAELGPPNVKEVIQIMNYVLGNTTSLQLPEQGSNETDYHIV